MYFFFFFNDTATTEIYTLSLHDALPIWDCDSLSCLAEGEQPATAARAMRTNASIGRRFSWCQPLDRKSTRLNSSHANISYAVFCLKKKKPLPNAFPQSREFHKYISITTS